MLEKLMHSPSEELYTNAIVHFTKVCRIFPKFMNHVESTILKPLKKKIVKGWTNHVMHFGNTTTNKVEYAHGRLKQYFKDGKRDLVRG